MSDQNQTEQQNTKQSKPTIRDERGLLIGVNHIFKKDGSIDWRAMVNPAHLYPNKDWFNRRNMPVPETGEGLRDDQLLIKLAGIKEIAKLRGYTRVHFQFPKLEKDYVVATCQIDWINSFETTNKLDGDESWSSINTMDVANATFDNTDGFGQKFLETIAANRAFVRAVRNYLGIHIVGEDEIAKGNGTKAPAANEGSADVSPQGVLQKKFTDIYSSGEFVDFKTWLRELWKEETYRNEAAKEWKSWSDVPAKEARTLLKFLK
jgi:hypothetical protein